MGGVAVVLITVEGVLSDCLDGVVRQKASLPRLDLIVNYRKPERFSDNAIVQKYENCHRNRNEARARALRLDSAFFLFLDDDIVLPAGAIRTLLDQRREVVGGYYPILGTRKYVCGRWVADNTFYNYEHVQRGLVRTDTVGLGCALLSRNVLERVSFEAGTDLFCRDAMTGRDMFVGECGMFGNRVAELGIPMFMCGDVVCEHLVRPPINGVNADGVAAVKPLPSPAISSRNVDPVTAEAR